MATNARGKMPDGWIYPTEEDNIVQDLPSKYEKTGRDVGPGNRKKYVYNPATHDKSKDQKP